MDDKLGTYMSRNQLPSKCGLPLYMMKDTDLQIAESCKFKILLFSRIARKLLKQPK